MNAASLLNRATPTWQSLSQSALFLPRSNVGLMLVALSQKDPIAESAQRIRSAIGREGVGVVALETSLEPMNSRTWEGLDVSVRAQTKTSNHLLFAFPPADPESTVSSDAQLLNLAIQSAHAANATCKAIDINPWNLVNPNKSLSAHFKSLISLYSLETSAPRVRTTPVSNAIYSALTSPVFISNSKLDQGDIATHRTLIKTWCTFHSKARYYLLDLRAAFMTRQLHGLACAAAEKSAANSVLDGSNVPQKTWIVAVVSKGTAFGIHDFWKRYVVPSQENAPSYERPSAMFYNGGAGSAADLSRDLLADDFMDALGNVDVKDSVRRDAAFTVSESQSRPGIQLIRGSRPVE
ncbi:hypothetical protein BJ741DRAFT_705887 [Chytriomyces cf. hyalinus JEL632]|nr:hypothetical protein BJ741DRAFT_705887 [Chytriomyces cf. hyalinus JEL632]